MRFYARGGFFRLYPFLICSAKFAYKAINALPRRVPILAASNSYFLTWQDARRILYRGIEGLEGRYPAAIGVSVPQGQDERRAESKSLQVEIWKKHIGLQRQVERTRGVPAYFFSSAHQYLQNSKPLSVEERATAINSDVADINHAQISILRRAVQDLATKGVPVFDLTGIFQETPATVYVDACCHMNELGNQIMAQHIVSVLAEQAMGNNARQ